MLPNLLGGKLLTGVLPLNTHENDEAGSPSQPHIVDIESCIDNPTLAPLGVHIRVLSDKPKRYRKNNDGQVKIQQRQDLHDLRQKDIYDTGLLMLRRKNLTTEELAQHLNTKIPPPPLVSFLDQQQLILQHCHRFDRLVELNISQNRLATLPIEITSLPHLRTLNASSNLLTHMPTEFCHLTHLQVLNLSQNQLYTIPDELPTQLPSLVTLSVAGNSIDYLTPNVNQWMHLQHLQLGSVFGGNRLTRLPDTIGSMPCLEELDISFNQLRSLPTTMTIPSLINLNTSHNQLDFLPAGIGQCHALKTLNVSKNYLTSLPATLVNLNNLELLDISENLLCIMPADILERMKGTLLITGNPLTRPGHCDGSDDVYSQMLKRMTMCALPIVSSSSSSTNSNQCGPQGNGSLSSSHTPKSTSSSDPFPPIHQSLSQGTSTSTGIIPSPSTSLLSLSNHHEDDTDDDTMLDRELSFLAQQLNVQGSRRDRQQPSTTPADLLPQQPLENESSVTISDATQPATPSLSTSSTSSSFSTITIRPKTPIQEDNLFSRSLLIDAADDVINDEASSCFTTNTTNITTSTVNMVHSLRELATRVILQSNHYLKIPLHRIPPHLAYDLSSRHRRRLCAKCELPFVNEWLTSVQVKSYGGHPAVVRRVRFCSTKCWKLYLHDQASSVVCVHRPDTQPIVQEEDGNDYLDATTYPLLHPYI